MNPIEIEVKRSYYTRIIIIGIFTLGIGALLLYMEYRRWGRIFDSAGVTRQDGKRFLWADLEKKVFIHMRGSSRKRGAFNHMELVFKEGKVLIFPLMLENAREVMAYHEKYQAKEKIISLD